MMMTKLIVANAVHFHSPSPDDFVKSTDLKVLNIVLDPCCPTLADLKFVFAAADLGYFSAGI